MITFLDQAGNAVRVQVHIIYEGVVTNPDTGQSVKDPVYHPLHRPDRGPRPCRAVLHHPGAGRQRRLHT